MFVQVIKGKATDAAGWRADGERWDAEVKPGAPGYLGGTAGITDDLTFVVIARFEDEASARANEARPEQAAWYEKAAQHIAGEPQFRETSDVSLLFDGGSDSAGFVQVMEGVVKDRAKAEAMETPELMAQLKTARPDLLGSMRAWFGDGSFVEVAYFTSEEDARKGESSSEFTEPHDVFDEVFGEMTFLDLRSPQLSSP